MPKQSEIEIRLDRIQNWALVSNKKNVLKGMEKLVAGGERVIDVLDGLYRGVKISGKSDVAGVIAVTDRRLLFVTSEHPSPQYEEIAFEEIRDIAYEPAFSSIIITIRLKAAIITFKTYDNRGVVTRFIETIRGRGGSTAPAHEENTLRMLGEIEATMSTLAEVGGAIGAARPGADGGGKLDIDAASLDFLYREAKKINKTFGELPGADAGGDTRSALVNDIIILSSLCRLSDRQLTAGELIFISLVMLPLDPDGTTGAAGLAGKIFAGDAFPSGMTGELLDYWNSISRYIKKSRDGIDLEGYALRTMNLLEAVDRGSGTSHADKAGSALYAFAQCLMKADGTLSADEEERLKQIHRLISRGAVVTSTAVSVKEAEEETLDQVMEKINRLVGMNAIKEQIATLVNLIRVQKEREERKLPVAPLSLHAVFYGPPGTGKTTIARLLGKVYRALGLLKKGQIVETDRAGLVAGYVGQTAINVDNVVQKALDGVLFIDEAYALIPDDIGGKDFGMEAVNTILKRMEDYRERLVVIVAGYTEEMDRFIHANPGLKSRFSRYFYFDHYTPDELLRIFDSFCKNVEFALEKEARDRALALLTALHAARDRTFGNGRLARNIFERVVEKQANRIAGISPLTNEVLCTITAQDIPEPNEMVGR